MDRGWQMRLDAGQIEVMDDAMADVLRAKSGSERLRIVDDLFRSARRLVSAGVRAQHPDWPQDQIDRETARRLLRGASDGLVQREDGIRDALGGARG